MNWNELYDRALRIVIKAHEERNKDKGYEKNLDNISGYMHGRGFEWLSKW